MYKDLFNIIHSLQSDSNLPPGDAYEIKRASDKWAINLFRPIALLFVTLLIPLGNFVIMSYLLWLTAFFNSGGNRFQIPRAKQMTIG